MTFLEIVQFMASRSGCIDGDAPSTVVSQTGIVADFVTLAQTAYEQIQNSRPDWGWMREEFTSPATTSSDTGLYMPAAWGLTSHRSWIVDDVVNSYYPTTLYLQSAGVAGEGVITFIPWNVYRMTYRRGTQTRNKPVNYSISPAGEFALGQLPDGAYIVKGEHILGNQSLTDDDDEPLLPSSFHQLIGWWGLSLWNSEDDAGQAAIKYATDQTQIYLAALERDQLPRIEITTEAIA